MKIKLDELEKHEDAYILYHAFLRDNIRVYHYDYDGYILDKYFTNKEDAEKYINSINNVIAYEGVINKVEIKLEDNEGLSSASIISITDDIARDDKEYLHYDSEGCEVYDGRQCQKEEILFILNALIDFNITSNYKIIDDEVYTSLNEKIEYYNYNHHHVRFVSMLERCIGYYIDGDYYIEIMGTDIQSLKRLKNICEKINEQFYNQEMKSNDDEIEIDSFIEFFNQKLKKDDNVEFVKTII